jgi:hypothetical protein
MKQTPIDRSLADRADSSSEVFIPVLIVRSVSPSGQSFGTATQFDSSFVAWAATSSSIRPPFLLLPVRHPLR